ncbi:hypothetical protein [Domibacillus indicus]|uniref:hypothetical protein n=1 Tax=Domibacillus indicus TaxID=1437523 RepID=UPI0006180A94|nr:hypothetical protein [Domibacillus indicus]
MASITYILLAGASAGLALGLFLKGVEAATGIAVYKLLLNVDFIPYINQVLWPEWAEFIFHLFISFLLSAGFFAILLKSKHPYTISFLLTLPAVFLYFPLSWLAHKPVPAANNMQAFAWWAAGHILYAFTLALFGQKYKREA